MMGRLFLNILDDLVTVILLFIAQSILHSVLGNVSRELIGGYAQRWDADRFPWECWKVWSPIWWDSSWHIHTQFTLPNSATVMSDCCFMLSASTWIWPLLALTVMVLDRLRWSTNRRSSSLHSLCSLPTWSSWAELLWILATTRTIDALIQPEPTPLLLKIKIDLDLASRKSPQCTWHYVIGLGLQALAFSRDCAN